MFRKSKKTSRLLFLLPLTATTLTSVCLFSTPAVEAGRSENPHQLKTQKISPLLKPKKHGSDETVTVIVSLNGSKSSELNAFLNRAGLRQRREMRKLGVFSLNLPFKMVAELASFPELNGTPKEVLEHRELMQLMSGLLRADFAVCQTTITGMNRPSIVPSPHMEAYQIVR